MNFVAQKEAKKGQFIQSFESKDECLAAGNAMEQVLRKQHIRRELVYTFIPSQGLVERAKIMDAAYHWTGTYQIFLLP